MSEEQVEDAESLRLRNQVKLARAIEERARAQPDWMKGSLFIAERPLRESLPKLEPTKSPSTKT